jgi:drug/metabolite transporter (DMT)-like permease
VTPPTTSGRWQLGLILALSTMALWATLPLALEITLEVLDPWTLTWYRFLAAFLIQGAFLAWTGQLRHFRDLQAQDWLVLTVAALCLGANYILFLLGMHHTSPANAQIIIQLAPMLMALGALAVFGERYSVTQWLGFAVIIAGMGLFFADQLQLTFVPKDTFYLGAGLMVLAAITWAIYALAQKHLLHHGVRAPLVLFYIYSVSLLLFSPLASRGAVSGISGIYVWTFAYCLLNTLGAYGCFTEALRHWEASRVGAILALVPLSTLFLVSVMAKVFPDLLTPERLSAAGWIGAVMVVVGSMLTSLTGRRRDLAVVHATTVGEDPELD